MAESFFQTVFRATLLGTLDEAYQYFVLYADNREVFFDFNDIVLNLIGAGIGVVTILKAHKGFSPLSGSLPTEGQTGYNTSICCVIISG